MNFKQTITLFIAALVLLFSWGCDKDKEDLSVADTGLCLVLFHGTFQQFPLDQEPEYLEGGFDGFINRFADNIKYPAYARENGIQGNCVVHYEISEEGIVENEEIIDDPGGGIGEEVLETLEQITPGVSFSPGILFGQPVRVRKELAVKFKLQ